MIKQNTGTSSLSLLMGILFYAFSETQALTPEGMMDQLEKNTAVDDI